MAFSWNKPTVSLAEALVGPGFGKDADGLHADAGGGKTGGISTQAAKKVMQAISEESLKKLKILLSSIDAKEVTTVVNSKDPTTGRTPLMMCCAIKDHTVRQKMVDVLLKNQADANVVDNDGRTALVHATLWNVLDVLQVLIACSKIDPNIADKEGNTPLIYAVQSNNDLAVRLLVRSFQKFGVLKIDAKNLKGETALSIAAANRSASIASVLINSGHASLDVRLKSGETTQKAMERAFSDMSGFSIHKCKNGEWKFGVDDTAASSLASATNATIEAFRSLDIEGSESNVSTTVLTPTAVRRRSFETSSRLGICESANADI